MAIYCGIDWAEGASRPRPDRWWAALLAKRRIEENLDGVTEMTAMLSAAGDSPDEPSRRRSRHRAGGSVALSVRP